MIQIALHRAQRGIRAPAIDRLAVLVRDPVAGDRVGVVAEQPVAQTVGDGGAQHADRGALGPVDDEGVRMDRLVRRRLHDALLVKVMGKGFRCREECRAAVNALRTERQGRDEALRPVAKPPEAMTGKSVAAATCGTRTSEDTVPCGIDVLGDDRDRAGRVRGAGLAD